MNCTERQEPPTTKIRFTHTAWLLVLLKFLTYLKFDDREGFEQLSTFSSLFSTEKAFKAFRDRERKGCTVPTLSNWTQDMTFAVDGGGKESGSSREVMVKSLVKPDSPLCKIWKERAIELALLQPHPTVDKGSPFFYSPEDK